MFLDQKEERSGDFIYIYGNKRALLYTGGGCGWQRRGGGCSTSSSFLHNSLQDSRIWADIRLVASWDSWYPRLIADVQVKTKSLREFNDWI